jgi:hypothetical protein
MVVVGAFALSGALLALRAAAAPGNETPEQLLAQLEADAAHKIALATPLEKARGALSRARAMDHSGDQAHAALMRAVARQWLDVARDLVRTVDLEARADQKEKALDELETKITRGQALLEETAARRARAQALLEQVERAEPAPPTSPKGKEKPGAAPTPASEPGVPSIPPRPGPLQLTPPSGAPVAPGRVPVAPPVPGKAAPGPSTAPKATPPPAPPSAAPKAVENPKAPAAPSQEPK